MPRTIVVPRHPRKSLKRAVRRSAQVRTAASHSDPDATDRIVTTPIPYMNHPDFAHRQFDDALPALFSQPVSAFEPTTRDLPTYLARLHETPLLTKADEEALFTQMNWLKYKAEQLRQSLHPSHPSPKKLETIRELLQRSEQVRNRIVQANLRLVVALARKFTAGVHSLDDLISEGHLPLIRAVELFDISRGNRFSTYATWAVRNHLARHVGTAKKRGEVVGYADGAFFESAPDDHEDDSAGHATIHRQRTLMSELLPRLSQRDQHVVEARFGLNDQDRSHSLSEIAGELGLSKERVRQLVLQAVERLRDYAQELKAAL
jgi:RNA polymerase sigma factor (sigma-70 family)